MTNPHRSMIRLLAVLGAVSLLAIACGGGEDGTAAGVASLEDVAAAEETDETVDQAAGENATLAADEAALAFSQCMRDEGLDFPDIGVDAEGNPNIGEAFQAADIQPGSAEFQEAIQTCGEILQGAGFGGGGRRGFADNIEIQDALVEFSECIRDQGFDVGDIQFGGGPGPGAGGGDGQDGPPENGPGRGQGGFGNRNNRIAENLGLDPEDPDVVAALDECSPIFDSAFAGFGPGANDNT